uniref:Si:ch211-194c3.5 n=1 Tax=Cyprinus carpio TaxID=7962 RepID=A0A8C2Q067_CYPCA
MEQIPEDFPEEVLDDVIILIKAECVHLYCNPVNYGYLLPYVSHWRNLQLHCLTETEYEDEEVAEEFKISSFVSMVQDCHCIGIPYSSHGHVQKFDMFMLEKWPIIQAFALEGIGAGVFFTMKYKLTDVSQRLWQVYSRLDPASLDLLLNEVNHLHRLLVKLTENNMLDMIPCVMLNLIFCVFQPFRTYYSHGLISSNITDKSKSRQPFVLFGSHSTKEDLENYCFTFPSEGHQVRNTGPGGGVAKHMLMQCVAPKGPLACARTYFFGSTHVPYLGNRSAQISSKLLSHIYSAVVQSVLAGIKCFSINSSASKAKDVAEQTFQLALDNFGLIHYRGALRSKAVFSIQAVNNEGTIIPLSDEDSRFMVKTASMMVHDIPDLHCGGNLGSVVFSESFLESSVYIQHLFSCRWQDGTCLGIPLTVRDSAYMFSNSLLSTPEEGKLVFFSEGILFVHPHHGSITLSMSHINTIKLYDGASLSDASMLFIKYQTSLLPHLPFPLHSADFSLAIALLPRTKSYKSFYSQVLTHTHTYAGGTFRFLSSCRKVGNSDFLSSVESILNASALITDYLIDSWEVFCPALEGSEEFSASHLQRFLSSLLAKQRETDLNSTRVVLLIPGYTDVLNVIQAITAHPDPQVHSQVTVGAVSACVNPLTSFIKHRLLFPKLLEQCSQGVVSNVIFTGLTTEQKHPLLKYMQQLIRAANPSTAFISAEKWVVRRTEDIRLILNDSSFSQSHMINARYLLYPGWWEGRFVSGSGSLSMSQHCIEFSRPLEKALFLQRCKALKSSLKPSSLTGNIYHISGKVLFSDNDRQMVVNCNSISGNVTIAPDQGTHHGPRTTNNCYLMFHGVGLTQEGLKDWLRHCAKQVNSHRWEQRTLTPQEIRYIHVKRHLDPLPPGYFYNGHHFVSFFGEKQNFHPLMDQFIDEYVQEANKEIEHFNREVDLQPHVDLFDP